MRWNPSYLKAVFPLLCGLLCMKGFHLQKEDWKFGDGNLKHVLSNTRLVPKGRDGEVFLLSHLVRSFCSQGRNKMCHASV